MQQKENSFESSASKCWPDCNSTASQRFSSRHSLLVLGSTWQNLILMLNFKYSGFNIFQKPMQVRINWIIFIERLRKRLKITQRKEAKVFHQKFMNQTIRQIINHITMSMLFDSSHFDPSFLKL